VQAVMPNASRDLIGTDLFSPGLVLAQYLHPIEAPDRATFSQSVANDLVSRLKLTGDDVHKVQQFVAEYAGAIPEEAWTTLTASKRSPFISSHAVRAAAGKQLELTQRILLELNLPKDRRDQFMNSRRVLLPTRPR
jgi:hypothetical protein